MVVPSALPVFDACNFSLKLVSIGSGKVWLLSQMSTSFEIFSFWLSGADSINGTIINGSFSAIVLAPNAYVP
jgi:hypothetical protein